MWFKKKTLQTRVVRFDTRDRSTRRVYRVVGYVALVVHAVSLLSTPLWVYPDSIDYIRLAGGIASRANFADDLFLIRPPGYPMMLAIVFKFFGQASPVVIQILQHAMGVGLALLTVALSLRVSSRRSVALVAGIFCSLSLQVLSYCNMPLTEVPFTLAFLGATYFLVRYWQLPSGKTLMCWSACAGVAYMIKPIGVMLFGIAAIAVGVRIWCRLRSDAKAAGQPFVHAARLFVGHCGTTAGVAMIPLLLIVAPWVVYRTGGHSSSATASCLDYVLYLRPLEFDRLDISTTKSMAMLDIRSVVAEASSRGLVPPEADYRDRLTAIHAYQRLRGLSFSQGTKILGRAGLDVMLEHPRLTLLNTIKYAVWMLLSPDPVYRFVPGGAPGVDGQRDQAAEFYGISTYSHGPGSWEKTLQEQASFLPLSSRPRLATRSWKAMVSAFRSHIDRRRWSLGIGDSLYEMFVLFCLSGAVLFVWRYRDGPALILLLTFAFYIGISAFFGGSQTRYVVVVKPLLCLWTGFSAVVFFDAIAFFYGGHVAARKGSPDVPISRSPRSTSTS